MPGFTFFTFKLVLSEDFSKDESNKWSGNKELPEEGHWKVSYDELTECRKYLSIKTTIEKDGSDKAHHRAHEPD